MYAPFRCQHSASLSPRSSVGLQRTMALPSWVLDLLLRATRKLVERLVTRDPLFWVNQVIFPCFFSLILHCDLMLVKEQWTVCLLKEKMYGESQKYKLLHISSMFPREFWTHLLQNSYESTSEASERMKRMKAQLHQLERSTLCVTTTSRRKKDGLKL